MKFDTVGLPQITVETLEKQLNDTSCWKDFQTQWRTLKHILITGCEKNRTVFSPVWWFHDQHVRELSDEMRLEAGRIKSELSKNRARPILSWVRLNVTQMKKVTSAAKKHRPQRRKEAKEFADAAIYTYRDSRAFHKLNQTETRRLLWVAVFDVLTLKFNGATLRLFQTVITGDGSQDDPLGLDSRLVAEITERVEYDTPFEIMVSMSDFIDVVKFAETKTDLNLIWQGDRLTLGQDGAARWKSSLKLADDLEDVRYLERAGIIIPRIPILYQ